MRKKDFLLIGNGITPSENGKWKKSYKDEIIHKWLIQVPKQIGLDEDDVSYDVRIKGARVEEIYILKKNKMVHYLGKTINFKKGDILRVAISYKYSKSHFRNILKKYFTNVNLYESEDGKYALVLCYK
jgi:hypothetical protein